MSYDPIEDEKKLFTLREWGDEMKAVIDDYVSTLESWSERARHPRTWSEWHGSFVRFMSW